MKTRFGHAAALILTVATAAVVPAFTPASAPHVDAVSCTVPSTLHPGARNSAVICVEQRLIELGYPGIVGPNDYYDPVSSQAVRAFQSDRGLYPDGIIKSITSRQLGLRGALPPVNAPRVTVLGDSTSAAMRWHDETTNGTVRYDVMGNTYDLLWSVESCRRLVAKSCVGRTNSEGVAWTPPSVLPLMQTTLRGKLGEAIVIMAGYDDKSITTAIESIMAEAKSQGVSKVFWLNYRLTNSYNTAYQAAYIAHNADLEAAKVRHPSLVVLDWNGFTYAQSAATQDLWFANDQIHMSAAGGYALANFLKASIDPYNIERCDPLNANAGVAGSISGVPTPTTVESGFQAIAPTRVLDTRDASLGGGNGKMGSARTVTIDLAGLVPDDAVAAVVNVTAADPCRPGFLTVFACGAQPATSNLNYVAGRTTAGMSITMLRDGKACIFSSAMTDLVVDLVGAFVPDGALFHAIDPSRWVDTRGGPAQVARIGQLPSGSQIDIPIAGIGGVPIDATAVWINLTATGSATRAVLQVYPGPCGAPPATSVVNVMPNRSAAVAAIVPLGSGGICVRTWAGLPHVVVDVSGWFGGALPGGRAFIGHTPIRLYDSRVGNPHATGTTYSRVATETAVYNVAAITSVGFGWVSAKPCGVSATTSLLNTAISENTANVGVVAPGVNGQICLLVATTTHLLLDQVGTFVVAT
ncbi:MAG: peptidoglycan-binding protein [Ilumatobacteraceae bacterium]